MACEEVCEWEIVGNDNESGLVVVYLACPDCGDSAICQGSRSRSDEEVADHE